VYTLICLCSVFAAVIEYAVISSISIYMNECKARETKKQEDKKKIEEEREGEEEEIKVKEEVQFSIIDYCSHIPGNCTSYLKTYFNIKPVTEMYVYKNTDEALDRIDEESKKYFPLVFACMMAIYWTTYLYLLEDEILQQQLENNQ
jgi:hypothetical protein